MLRPHQTLPVRLLMLRQLSLWFFVFCVCLSASCQPMRIQQYAAPAPASVKKDQKQDGDDFLYRLSWTEPRGKPHDLAIVFVASSHDDWQRLPTYWNPALPPLGGMRTVHLGLPPLQALAA